MNSPIRTIISLCGRGYTQDDPAILECVQRNGGGRILKRFSQGVNAVLIHPSAEELDPAKQRKLEEYRRLGFPVFETRAFRTPQSLSSQGYGGPPSHRNTGSTYPAVPQQQQRSPVQLGSSYPTPQSQYAHPQGPPAKRDTTQVPLLDIIPINGKKFQVQANLDIRVGDLKRIVAGNSGIPVAQQRLLYSGQELTVAKSTLHQIGVGRHNNYAIHLVKKPTGPRPGENNLGPETPAKPVVVIDEDEDLNYLEELNGALDLPPPNRLSPSTNQNQAHVVILSDDFPEPLSQPSSSTYAFPTGTGRKRKVGASPMSSSLPTTDQRPPPEKRLTRFRGSCPQPVLARINRAKVQRLFLISQKDETREGFLRKSFAVMGSTGNIYNVAIEQRPRCDCPDFAKGNLCKHILFVYLKVLRQPDHCSYIYQTSLLQCELKAIFDTAPKLLHGCLARKEVITAYRKVTGEGDVEEDKKPGIAKEDMRLEKDCPVCFDEIIEGGNDDLVYCRDGCKKALHKQCQQMWARSKRGGEVTCIFCRAPWPSETSASKDGAGVKMTEGYVNLGELQGQSAVRDTSGYSEWWRGSSRSHWRRRNW